MKQIDSYNWDTIMTVEDSLQEAGVFRNGISNNTCHSDSYMTIVSFQHLDQWLAEQSFDKEMLKYCCDYWSTNENMQPPLRIVASTIKRFIDNDKNSDRV